MTSIVLINPQQGHQAITHQLWPMLKAKLTAGHRMVVTAQEQEDERTLRQNRFYWGVVLKCTSEQAKINGVGATDDGWHLYFRREHLGYRFTKTKLPGKTRPSITKELRSTRDLSVKKMSIYLEKCIAQACTDFGVAFPVKDWEQYRVDHDTGEILGMAA